MVERSTRKSLPTIHTQFKNFSLTLTTLSTLDPMEDLPQNKVKELYAQLGKVVSINVIFLNHVIINSNHKY